MMLEADPENHCQKSCITQEFKFQVEDNQQLIYNVVDVDNCQLLSYSEKLQKLFFKFDEGYVPNMAINGSTCPYEEICNLQMCYIIMGTYTCWDYEFERNKQADCRNNKDCNCTSVMSNSCFDQLFSEGLKSGSVQSKDIGKS